MKAAFLEALLLLFVSCLNFSVCIANQLPKGTCSLCSPEKLEFDCQLATFGGYVHQEDESIEYKVAYASDPFACTEISNEVEGKIVIVQRGTCVFQDKLKTVEKAGGLAMILVNQDDTLIQMGSLQYFTSEAPALAMTKKDGDHLIDIISHGSDPIRMKITTKASQVEQCAGRIEYYMFTNAPVVAYETFMNCFPRELSLYEMLDQLIERLKSPTPKISKDLSNFFFKSTHSFASKWDFANEASFYSSLGAVFYMDPSTVSMKERHARYLTLTDNLLLNGYYKEAHQTMLKVVQEDPNFSAGRCKLALIYFLEANVEDALSSAHSCLLDVFDLGVNSSDSLHVAQENLVRLASFDVSDHDQRCLKTLRNGVKPSDMLIPCCRSTGIRSKFAFSSTLIEEIFHSLTIMGVFLDELGAFEASLQHFQSIYNLCGLPSLVDTRIALGVPVVFDNKEHITTFMDSFLSNIKRVETTRRNQEEIFSSMAGTEVSTQEQQMHPERAAYLRYTITPPTMMVGYQGLDAFFLQRAIYSLRYTSFPSLRTLATSSLPPSKLKQTSTAPRINHEPIKRRIGFVSSWFRTHSVGKLILGIIKKLDRTKFHVNVYRSRHFFRAGDQLTNDFRRAADSYLDLPPILESAIEVLRHEKLDVLIFPEIGMDEWMVYLSYHRFARVQCVFWGHPVTTANPAIDYFISSEYFLPDFFEENFEDKKEIDSKNMDTSPGQYHKSTFSEQMVLFRGLSTFFTKPKVARRFQNPSSHARAVLHLPEDKKLYVCPQTLMKLHPDFDHVLHGILSRDKDAYIIMLYSSTQNVWKEKVRMRWRRTLGRLHTRIIFYSTMPYTEFMSLLSIADVLLDPFPWGGGVTTLDGLAFGIPVVTLPSSQTVVQLAAGFFRYIGVTDCIAKDEEDFINMAVEFANNKELRERVSEKIIQGHGKLYEDEYTLDEWNTFLASV